MLKDPNHFTIFHVGYAFHPFADNIEHVQYPIYIITNDVISRLGSIVLELTLDNVTIPADTQLTVYSKLYGLEIVAFNKTFYIPVVTLSMEKIPNTIFYTTLYPYDTLLDKEVYRCTNLNLTLDLHLELYNADSSYVTFTLERALPCLDLFNILDKNQHYVSQEEFPQLLESLGYQNLAETIVKLYTE